MFDLHLLGVKFLSLINSFIGSSLADSRIEINFLWTPLTRTIWLGPEDFEVLLSVVIREINHGVNWSPR